MVKQKEIGLFFGSFNPIHHGHLMIANYFLCFAPFDEVWFVVSPQNPLKNKTTLASEYHRLEMVNLAIGDFERFRATDIEFNMPKPSYTIDTLIRLSDKYPHYRFSLIMGSDNLASFEKWKNYEIILRDYNIYVYPRKKFSDHPFKHYQQVKVVNAPQIEISSTFIREAIKNKLNIQFFLPEKVYRYILDCNIYK
ncbi:MAG: nicotinate (nicotinamide) nucleotide adenylyltransferase [Bacteroidales bacterium]